MEPLSAPHCNATPPSPRSGWLPLATRAVKDPVLLTWEIKMDPIFLQDCGDTVEWDLTALANGLGTKLLQIQFTAGPTADPLGPFESLDLSGTPILRAAGNKVATGGAKYQGCYTYIVRASHDGGTEYTKVDLLVDPQVDNMADPPKHIHPPDPDGAGDSWREAELPDFRAIEP
jgi:hypothetical protein